MRKTILITAGLLSFLVLLFQPSVSGMLIALIFLGMIPGTSLSIPSWLMLLFSLTGMVVAIRWIYGQPLFIGSQAHQEKTARQLARKKVLAMTAAPRPAPARATTRRRLAKAKV